jgi:excisionase family DNA binding protein
MTAKSAEVAIEPSVLSIAQAGMYLAVSPDTVRRLIRGGSIPHARIGNSIRIRRQDLDSYVEGQISRQWHPVDNRGRGCRPAC